MSLKLSKSEPSGLNNIEYLEELVNSGRSLRTMRQHFHCGADFLLKRLKKFNLVDQSLTVEDCKVPGHGTVYATIRKEFPYEEYVERHIKGGETLVKLSKEKNFNYNNLKDVARKYKNRFKQDSSKSSI